MGMVPTRQEGNRYRFAMPDAQAPGHLLDVVVGPSAPRGNPGGGTVHHIASRTRNSKEQAAWQQRLRHRGMAVTDVRDRRYFRTFYFHEPDGILFGIATDPPGFGVDENPRNLGAALKLPPPPRRTASPANRKPAAAAGIHRFSLPTETIGRLPCCLVGVLIRTLTNCPSRGTG